VAGSGPGVPPVAADAAVYSSWDFGGNHVTQGYWANFNPQFLNYWWTRLGAEYNPTTVDSRATRAAR
jgi:hypothetical protein